ncbi:MAG: hypothetical protein IJK26_10195 [Clostridia bacterium]|nr:hypothetical protein [Clostridia bacterium]
MSEGNDNQLYLSAYDMEVGVCTDYSSKRNTNTLVIGSPYDTANYYVKPNLHLVHSSAVIVGDLKQYQKDIGQLREQGVTVHIIDFDNETANNSSYSPFINRPQPLEYEADKLAFYYEKYFSAARNDTDDPFLPSVTSSIASVLLRMVFLYVMSAEMPDNERNFKTVLKILQDMRIIVTEGEGVSGLEKYDISEGKKYYNFLLSTKLLEKTITDALIYLFVDLQSFNAEHINNVFTAGDKAYTITAQSLTNKPTYIFIQESPTGAYTPLICFFLKCLLNDLRYYGEQVGKSAPTLPRPVHFYLIPQTAAKVLEFIKELCIARPYRIGFSLLAQNLERDIAWFSEEDREIVYAGCDANLFFGVWHCDNDFDITYIRRSIGSCLTADKIECLLSKGKVILSERGFYPIIGDRLNNK